MAFLLFARILMGAVFLMSAVTKLAAPSKFVANAHNFQILPRDAIRHPPSSP